METPFASPRNGSPKQRPRNLAFDALAEVDGIHLPEKPSKTEAGRIVRAMSVIKEISPNVTPEEIQAAAEEYRHHWPQIDCTSTALASHWRRFNSAARARRVKAAEMEGLKAQMMNSCGEDYALLQRRLTALEDQREG